MNNDIKRTKDKAVGKMTEVIGEATNDGGQELKGKMQSMKANAGDKADDIMDKVLGKANDAMDWVMSSRNKE